jgi:hypothetical protein
MIQQSKPKLDLIEYSLTELLTHLDLIDLLAMFSDNRFQTFSRRVIRLNQVKLETLLSNDLPIYRWR